MSNGRNDVLVGVPYASSYEFTEFLFLSVSEVLSYGGPTDIGVWKGILESPDSDSGLRNTVLFYPQHFFQIKLFHAGLELRFKFWGWLRLKLPHEKKCHGPILWTEISAQNILWNLN